MRDLGVIAIRGKRIVFLQSIWTGTGTYQLLCPVGTMGCFWKGKSVRVWSQPLSPSKCWGYECV